MNLPRGVARAAAAALLTIIPAAAQGQDFRFQGVAWGITADSVRPRIEALGFRHVRTYENGDLRFRSDADVVVAARFAAGKLVDVMESWPVAGEPLDARFAAAADSLKRLYGTPINTRRRGALWRRGYTLLEVNADSGRGEAPAGIQFWYRGPGSDGEVLRRMGEADPFAPLDSAWVVISRNDEQRFALESASISRRPDGSYRAQIRLDHSQTQPDPSGPYDAIIYGFDIDCAGRRLQMRSRTALAKGRQVRSDRGATVWLPVRTGTPQAALLEAVCAYVTR